MEENGANKPDYLKYRDRFMRYGVFNVAATASAILFAVMMLFVPMFSIDLIIATEWFSLFDEISLVFKGAFDSGSMMYIISGLFMILMIVMGFVSIIKQVIAMTNPDDYVLQRYDDIKKRGELGARVRKYDMSGKGILINMIMGVVILVVGIILSSMLGGDKEKLTSYFSICTGVNGLIVFAILFLLAAIVLIVMASSIDGKITLEITKKEYAENTVVKPVAETASKTAAADAEEIANADVKDVK